MKPSAEMEAFATAMREHIEQKIEDMPTVVSVPKPSVTVRPTILVDTTPIAKMIGQAIGELSKNLADKLKQDMTPIALSLDKMGDKPPVVAPVNVDFTPLVASSNRMAEAIERQSAIFAAMTKAFDRLAAALENSNAKKPQTAVIHHGENESTVVLE